jgi:hypothetical protein
MGYRFEPGLLYRMPTHFGPSLGPRQGPGGRRYACKDTPRQTIVEARFSAESAQLEPLLPPGFSLQADPWLHFSFAYITEIEWLAGRGYNTFGVSVPVHCQGEHERLSGALLLVLWENMADPIVTGREDLGFAKVYGELPPPLMLDGRVVCRASWDGCEFARLELDGVGTREPWPADPRPYDGTLHYRYAPRIGATGEAELTQAVLTPAAAPQLRVLSDRAAAQAAMRFERRSWEQLPTLVHIVDVLASLRPGALREARVMHTVGFKDLSDQRLVR